MGGGTRGLTDDPSRANMQRIRGKASGSSPGRMVAISRGSGAVASSTGTVPSSRHRERSRSPARGGMEGFQTCPSTLREFHSSHFLLDYMYLVWSLSHPLEDRRVADGTVVTLRVSICDKLRCLSCAHGQFLTLRHDFNSVMLLSC